MFKKIIAVVGILMSSFSFAENNWFVGGSAGVDANINPTSFGVAVNFDFGYQWTNWQAFGEVDFSGGLKGGGDYLLRLSKKDYMNFGLLAGVDNKFNNFSFGGQVGYNYYILPELTIGGGGRVEYFFGDLGDANLGPVNISGLFTVSYHIPNR